MKNECFICKKTKLRYFISLATKYQSCSNCKTISMVNLPSDQQISDHYKKKNKQGNYLLNTNYKDYDDIYRPIIKIIKKKVNHFRELSILDIGCFRGFFLKLCMKQGWKIRGYEFQDEAIEFANNYLGKNVVKKKNLNNQSIKSETYEVVTLIGVVEHVKDPVKLIKNACKLVKKKGIIIIQTPNSTSVVSNLLGKFWPCIAPVEHLHLFSKDSLKMQFNNLNFKNIEVNTHWKYLTIDYVYKNLSNFGPQIKKIIKPFYKILPNFLRNKKLYFNGGEMLFIAQKI
jgi:2-polyprenyl-3-methyl-5-hydroxy-6-metoxy-1,4-benzoquinol methylase